MLLRRVDDAQGALFVESQITARLYSLQLVFLPVGSRGHCLVMEYHCLAGRRKDKQQVLSL